mmetsp:Transcript_65394/g.77412  ORF Transcript_65394/g.77412 Transcript_65394/m.77412 type:complete len:205 (-) Transcript_65394:1744-2358(-)
MISCRRKGEELVCGVFFLQWRVFFAIVAPQSCNRIDICSEVNSLAIPPSCSLILPLITSILLLTHSSKSSISPPLPSSSSSSSSEKQLLADDSIVESSLSSSSLKIQTSHPFKLSFKSRCGTPRSNPTIPFIHILSPEQNCRQHSTSPHTLYPDASNHSPASYESCKYEASSISNPNTRACKYKKVRGANLTISPAGTKVLVMT